MLPIGNIPNEGTTLADRTAETRTLPANGGDRKTDQPDKTENVRLISDYGTSSAYRLGKIKRDHPELADR